MADKLNNNKPLNMGTILHAAMGLRLENCPYAVSRKNNGTPHRHKKITYGMKNAPESGE